MSFYWCSLNANLVATSGNDLTFTNTLFGFAHQTHLAVTHSLLINVYYDKSPHMRIERNKLGLLTLS